MTTAKETGGAAWRERMNDDCRRQALERKRITAKARMARMAQTKCNVEGCNFPVRNISRGICSIHYDNFLKYDSTTSPHAKLTETERFHSKYEIITETGCWIWTEHLSSSGYGQFSVNRKARIASRVSWELHFGVIPGGLLVCHRCDVPSCVNPNHLFLGSPKDNSADMVEKLRSKKGESHPRSKLTNEAVKLIRSGNKSDQEWADIFGVYRTAVVKVRLNRTWKI